MARSGSYASVRKARKAYVSPRAEEKIGRVSALPGINLSVWFDRPIPKVALYEPLSGILSNQTTSTVCDRFILSAAA